MNAFLQFESETIMEFENELIAFEGATGLRVNYNKTSLYRIGSLINTNAQLFTRKPFVWTNGPLKILGVDIDHNAMKMSNINLENLIERTANAVKLWTYRGLTLMGRVLVVNSLCASLFVYKLTVLGTLPRKYLDKFNAIIKNFLWNGGRPKMNLAKLQNPKDLGGLKLINLEAKDKALKAQWVAKIKMSENIQNLSEQFLPSIGQDLWMCNFAVHDVKHICKDGFWSDVVKTWSQLYPREPSNPTQIAAQTIWYNTHIKIAGKVIFYPKAHEAGMFYLYNIWNKLQNTFFSFEQIQEIYGLNTLTYIQYFGILSAIPAHWIRELKNTRNIVETFQWPYETFEGKMTSIVYDKIVSDKKALIKVNERWNLKLRTNTEYDTFLQSFENIYKLTSSTKIRNFQFRFLHRIVFCSNKLFRWKVVDSPRCTFCDNDIETLEHLYFYCVVTKRFWEMFQAWFEALTDTEVDILPQTITYCNHEDDLYNTLLLLAKQYIFRTRCLDKTLNVYNFKDYVMEIIQIERYQAFKNKKFKPFVKKWKRMFSV